MAACFHALYGDDIGAGVFGGTRLGDGGYVRASATVDTFATHAMPALLSFATKAGGYSPMTEETIGGCAASSASHCAVKSGGVASPAFAATAGPKRSKNVRRRSS
jgi:hypothetical protein